MKFPVVGLLGAVILLRAGEGACGQEPLRAAAFRLPEEKCEAFTQKLLPLVGNVFSIYDLSDDNFALSPEYDLLYTELTGAVILYIEEYGV